MNCQRIVRIGVGIAQLLPDPEVQQHHNGQKPEGTTALRNEVETINRRRAGRAVSALLLYCGQAAMREFTSIKDQSLRPTTEKGRTYKLVDPTKNKSGAGE